MFLKSPAFVFSATGCLVLGIGVNILIFSLVDSVLLRPLPYPQADALVVASFVPKSRMTPESGATPGNYVALAERNRSFASVIALQPSMSVIVSDDSPNAQSERVEGQMVTANLPEVLGVSPMLGRWFRPEDENPTAWGGLVIGYGLWQEKFGGSRDVVGTVVRLDNVPAMIVGVMPPGFELLNANAAFWLQQQSLGIKRAIRSPNRLFTLVARLKPGVNVEAAQSEMETLAKGLEAEHPEVNEGWTVKLTPLKEVYVGSIRPILLAFQAASVFVLLIACANAAGLILTRATARNKELAIRLAMGAGRRRTTLRLLTETLLLSLAGGIGGTLLAWIGVRVFKASGLRGFPRLADVQLSVSALMLCLVISVVVGIALGVITLFQAYRLPLAQTLRETGRNNTASRSTQRVRAGFVIVQVALAFVLVVGTGLLANSFFRLNTVDVGFDVKDLLTVQVSFPRGEYMKQTGTTASGQLGVELSPRVTVLTEAMRQRLSEVQGVDSVAAAVIPPLGGAPHELRVARQGTLIDASSPTAQWYAVSADYFGTLGVPVIEGREFGTHDLADGTPVAVVNEALAKRLFPSESPLGRLIQVDFLNDPVRQIIGVVGDVRQDKYAQQSQTQLYVPRPQVPLAMDGGNGRELLVSTFIVRSTRNAEQLLPNLRSSIASIDRTLAVSNASSVEAYSVGQTDDLRHYTGLLLVFAGLSLALAVSSVYAATLQSVAERRGEIATRLVLGGEPSAVLLNTIRRIGILVCAGIATGTGFALVFTQLIRGLLWGVTASDPSTYAMALAVLSIIALVACYVPARRVLKIDPALSLRAE